MRKHRAHHSSEDDVDWVMPAVPDFAGARMVKTQTGGPDSILEADTWPHVAFVSILVSVDKVAVILCGGEWSSQ
jgi:hypothetical protein